MALTKYAVGTPLQGYPKDGKLLATDVEILLDEYESDQEKKKAVQQAQTQPQASAKGKKKPKGRDASTLLLGLACYTIKDAVHARMRSLRDTLAKLAPKGVNGADIQVHMGPIKLLDRIMQKSVHYAVCGDPQSAQPCLNQVNDILRATIEFPAAFLEKPGIGGAMIDAVNTEFKGTVVQVKNRFVELDYPPFEEYSGSSVDQELRKQIIAYVSRGMRGRDSFYRDIQLLVQLGGKEWATGSDFSHVMFEVQLVPTEMYAAKSKPGADGRTGHDLYKVFRCVAEHCEYAVATKNGADTPKFASAVDYYPDPAAASWLTFTQTAQTMWELYKSVTKNFKGNVQNAIDESEWYKAATKK